MLTVSDVSKAYGARTLFEGVNMQVNRGDHLALVGANGAGKSTLFSLILGVESPDGGVLSVEKRAVVGHLAQETADVGDLTVLDIALSINSAITAARLALRAATDDQGRADAEMAYSEADGYELEPKAKRILSGLAFRETDFDRPAAAMSGGWIMRAHLARLLVMEPDLLMLDEPTNHLDLESVGWFQNHLLTYPGALLMISHDRAFINALADGIIELRNRRAHRYAGNYDTFLVEREARASQHLAAYRNQQKRIDSLQEFADRFRAKASKASQAQSKLREIERMDKIDAPENDEKTISMRFPQPPRSGQRVITLKEVHHAYGELVVYRGINLEMERGERMVLVGPNGAGKSTLLKLLAGVLTVQQGENLLGHNVRAGYFAQNRVENLDPRRSVLEEAQSIERPANEQATRTVLGSFLFRGDDVFKPVAVLSGGEKSRLALVKLLLDPPNLLLMDEPTTHLDMPSIDALITALDQYEGTLVFISHDVYFIRKLAKLVLHINAGRLTPYAGDYQYYLDKSKATDATQALVAGDKLTDSRPEEAVNTTVRGPSVFKTKEQKRAEAEARQAKSNAKKTAKTAVEHTEREILALEARQKSLTDVLGDPGQEANRVGGVMALHRELANITDRLERLNQDWAVATEKLEALENEIAQ